MSYKNNGNTYLIFYLNMINPNFGFRKIFNGRKLKDYLLDRLGQRMDTLSKKIRQAPMPCGRISQERVKENLLLKSWDLKHEEFGSPTPPHGRILHPHDPYFLAHELRKRYHFI